MLAKFSNYNHSGGYIVTSLAFSKCFLWDDGSQLLVRGVPLKHPVQASGPCVSQVNADTRLPQGGGELSLSQQASPSGAVTLRLQGSRSLGGSVVKSKAAFVIRQHPEF